MQQRILRSLSLVTVAASLAACGTPPPRLAETGASMPNAAAPMPVPPAPAMAPMSMLGSKMAMRADAARHSVMQQEMAMPVQDTERYGQIASNPVHAVA